VDGAAEAILLGFASGPVCVASCGPVLLPWLAAQSQGFRGTIRSLSIFLGGRLAGYLVFAVGAWAVGMAAPVDNRSRALIFSLANLGLAALLVTYVCLPRTGCLTLKHCGEPLVQIGPVERFRSPATLTLGLVTGLNLCPPFVAAGVRAAQTHSLVGSLAFFLFFFAGTAVWFLPAAAITPLRRVPAVSTVARMMMILLAVYYLYLGILGITWRLFHA